MSRAMKDSGIPWIGEIPSHWRAERIKTIFSERTELSEDGTEDLLSVSEYYGVDKRAERVEEGDFVSRSESLVGYKKCYKGDFVSNIMLAWKGSLGVSDYDGVVSPAYCVYKPSESVYPKYYHYLFRTSLYTGRFRCFSKGIIDSRLRLYSPYFFDIEAIIPPKKEQQDIADFLDKKCGEIDEMVSLQEKIVEELKAYKQSVITEVVCRGLNPDVSMKDSGIEWIGQIPEGWEILKTLWALDMPITDGPHTTPELFDTGIPFVSAEAVSCGNGGIDFSHIRGFISQEFYEECCLKYVPQRGDVYMIKSGATTGRVSIVDTDKVFTIWSPLAVFRANPKRILPRFLFYSLQGEYYQEQVRLGWTYGTQQNIGMRTLETLQIVLPTLSEQQAIVDYLDKQCKGIDTLISLKQSKIDALKEYKKSIIYEYITGKKEVNG